MRRALTLALSIALGASAVAQGTKAPGTMVPGNPATLTPSLKSDLDGIFSDPVLARALMSVRVDSLRTGETIYALNADKLVMPASNLKILTMTTAAEKLGWGFTYKTTLEASGPVADGILHGDLIVVGGGDPTIVSNDGGPAPLFDEWAAALRKTGIKHVDGRILADDWFFADPIGMGWSWDDLVYGYSAPITGLSYNENQVNVKVTPAAAPGKLATIALSPAAGHGLRVTNYVMTVPRPADAAAGDPRLRPSIDYHRLEGSDELVIGGRIVVGASPANQTVSVDNPTRFFVSAFRDALIGAGIIVTGPATVWNDSPDPGKSHGPLPGPTVTIATRTSPPLSVIGPYFMKASQNFVAETLLRTLGAVFTGAGTADAGMSVVRQTLHGWGIPDDAIVMRDGSGLSRYNYVTTSAIVMMLTRMWKNDALRGPFAAALPVAAHDGTLSNRMKNTWLDQHVQAKTGTIANVRSLSGYLETRSGERIVFSMIGNHFTVPASQIDALTEKALALIADRR